MKQYRTIGITSLLSTISIDRLSKLWALQHAQRVLCGAPPFNDSWCSFILTHNTGIAWSIGEHSSHTGNLILMSLVGLVTMLCVGFFIHACIQNRPAAFALGLISGGAISNLYDRYIYGAVIDFIWLHRSFSWGSFSWPLFNLADCCICLGGAIWWLSAIQEEL